MFLHVILVLAVIQQCSPHSSRGGTLRDLKQSMYKFMLLLGIWVPVVQGPQRYDTFTVLPDWNANICKLHIQRERNKEIVISVE